MRTIRVVEVARLDVGTVPVDRIVVYDEIPDKEEVFLSDLSFSHAPLPGSIEEARRIDSRLPKDFSFFALGEDGELLGRAAVGFTEVDTKEGRLRLGVMWGVRTSPQVTESGVARTIANHAHEYLRAKEVDVLSLGVLKYSVIRRLYRKMGYSEIDEGIRATAAKWAEKRNTQPLCVSNYRPGDADQVQEILAKSNEGLFGYTCRENDFISKRCFLGGYDPSHVSVYRNEDEIVGYSAFRSKGPMVRIGEIRAVNEEAYRSILAEIENPFVGLPVQISNGFSTMERRWLVNAGYTIRPGGYGTQMMHGLGRRSVEELRDILGLEEGLFRQQTLFDSF